MGTLPTLTSWGSSHGDDIADSLRSQRHTTPGPRRYHSPDFARSCGELQLSRPRHALWLIVVLVLPWLAVLASSAASVAAAETAACTATAEPDDQPEQAPVLTGDVCLEGTLVPAGDQDLALWTLAQADGLLTWTFAVDGIPTSITSIHVYPVTSRPDAPKITVGRELLRVDSSAENRNPGVKRDVTVAPGRYLLGVSRGNALTDPPPSDTYRVTLERQEALPPSGDHEPNDAPDQATGVAAAFTLSGDLDGSRDVYRWTLGPDDTQETWDVDVQGLAGSSIALTLEDDERRSLATVNLGR